MDICHDKWYVNQLHEKIATAILSSTLKPTFYLVKTTLFCHENLWLESYFLVFLVSSPSLLWFKNGHFFESWVIVFKSITLNLIFFLFFFSFDMIEKNSTIIFLTLFILLVFFYNCYLSRFIRCSDESFYEQGKETFFISRLYNEKKKAI